MEFLQKHCRQHDGIERSQICHWRQCSKCWCYAIRWFCLHFERSWRIINFKTDWFSQYKSLASCEAFVCKKIKFACNGRCCPTRRCLVLANCSICRGSSSSVSAEKEKTRTKFVLIFLWCGLRKTNGAVAPVLCTWHCVSYLFAMSAVHDFYKCCALAVLFACGLPRLVASKASVIAERANIIRQSEASTLNNPCCALCLRFNAIAFWLFAMSAALDVRKCFALASLFACGQSDGVRVAQKCAVRSIARKPRCPQKKKKHEQSSCLSFCGAVTETWTRTV